MNGAARVLWRITTTGILPLLVAYGVLQFLSDPARTNTSELRSYSLLMNARPMFRSTAESDVLVTALASSAVLFLAAVAWATAVAVPVGIAYAWWTNRAFKAAVWGISTLAAALPAFFWAVALSLVMIYGYLNFGWIGLPNAGFGVDQHIILPSLALGARPAAIVFRLTARAVEEIRHTDYVRTATAKGLGGRQLLAGHVLRNAAPQIVAAVVLASRGALSSLIIVEFVYVWGGAALTFVQALGQRRLELATEIAVAFAAASILLTIAADAAQARVRAPS